MRKISGRLSARALVVALACLAGCDGGPTESDGPLDELFGGVVIGADSAEVVSAMERRGWRAAAPVLAHRNTSVVQYRDSTGESLLLFVLTDGALYTATRRWTYPPHASAAANERREALAAILDRTYERLPGEGISSFWRVSDAPSTIMAEVTTATSALHGSGDSTYVSITATDFERASREH